MSTQLFDISPGRHLRLGAVPSAERARTELRATGETIAAREVNAFALPTPQTAAGTPTGGTTDSGSAPARTS